MTLMDLLSSPTDWQQPGSLLWSLFWKGSLVLLLAVAINKAGRKLTAALRHLTWILAIAALLLLPILTLGLPEIPIRVLPATVFKPAETVVGQGRQRTDRISENRIVSASRQPVSPPENRSGSPVTWLVMLYGSGSVLLSLYFAIGLARIILFTRGSRTIENEPYWRDLLASYGVLGSLRRPIRILEADSLIAPVSWGCLKPVIIMPAEAASWPKNLQRAALIHEIAHIRRWDWLTQLMSRLACVLYWFHPLVWMAMKRVGLESERSCDDQVLRQGLRPSAYAGQLLDLSCGRIPWTYGVPAIGMARKSQIGERISAILNPQIRRKSMTSRSLFTSLLITVFCVTVLAVAELVPVPSPQTGSLERQLVEALDRGDSAEARRAIQAGADVNASFAGEGSPLILASWRGNLELVRLLIDRGADANLVESGRSSGRRVPRTALNAAAERGYADVVRLLVSRGADPGLAPSGDATPLMTASEQGFADIARFLIDQGADVNRALSGDGTALILAAREGRADLVDLLIDEGADVNLGVEGDGNPLIMAARGGFAGIVETLLASGADVDAWVAGDENALVAAAEAGHLGIVRILLEKGADPKTLRTDE